MTLHTVNVSRARSKGRNKRAKKAVSILQEELERREGEEVSVSTEVNQEIWKNGATKPPRKVRVEVVESEGELWAVLAGSKERPETPSKTEEAEDDTESEEESAEEETEGDESESEDEEPESSEDVDYEEILSGTVSEVKDAVNDLEDPDYEKLAELEEEGKDRKTVLEFLEKQ